MAATMSMPSPVGGDQMATISVSTLLQSVDLARGGPDYEQRPQDLQQSPALQQMLHIVAALQAQLQESESNINDLQVQVDTLEEQRRAWTNRADRAELERDKVAKRTSALQNALIELRSEVEPIVKRFMEVEVGRSQLPVQIDELQRLKDERAANQAELELGYARLADGEDAEQQCKEAMVELEQAHAEELAVNRSLLMEEVADIRARHASRFAEIESMRQQELAQLRVAHAEELGGLQSSCDDLEWQAEVCTRECQDAIREACLRQRENARLARCQSVARSEAIELGVKLDALRVVASSGASARQAEIVAIRQRCALLERTGVEWRESLERKNIDCERWRRRACQLEGSEVGDELDMNLRTPGGISTYSGLLNGATQQQPQTPQDLLRLHDAGTQEASGHDICISLAISPEDTRDLSPVQLGSPLPPPNLAKCTDSILPPPPPLPYSSGRSARSSDGGGWRGRSLAVGAGGSARPTAAPRNLFAAWRPPAERRRSIGNNFAIESSEAIGLVEYSGQSRQPPRYELSSGYMEQPYLPPRAASRKRVSRMMIELPSPQPAEEFLVVALRVAQLKAEVVATGSVGDTSVKGINESFLASFAAEAEMHAGGSNAAKTAVQEAAGEAENELEMLTFLLSDGDAEEASMLLELEARRQPPVVARHLRALLTELGARVKNSSSLSPPPLILQ